MSRRERNWLIVLAAVAAVSLPLLPIWGGGGAAGGGGARGAAEGGGVAGGGEDRWASLPALRLDLLDAAREPFAGARRNLFDYDTRRAAQEESDSFGGWELGGDDAQDEEFDNYFEEEEAESQPPRLTDYEYLGYHEISGRRTAAFIWRGSYFVGTVGSTINNAFEIIAIEEESVGIHVINGDFEQRLQLESPVGESGQGVN